MHFYIKFFLDLLARRPLKSNYSIHTICGTNESKIIRAPHALKAISNILTIQRYLVETFFQYTAKNHGLAARGPAHRDIAPRKRARGNHRGLFLHINTICTKGRLTRYGGSSKEAGGSPGGGVPTSTP